MTDRSLDAVYRLLRELGAGFPLGLPPDFPRIDPARLAALKPVSVQPAFTRRCLVSDIMTWHYAEGAPFALHLAHDQEFIPWMARNAINAFFFIRHPFDTRYRIEEIEALYRERGIDVEYGGHVIQQLLPREYFAEHPEYFPAAADGARMQMGNLCVANRGCDRHRAQRRHGLPRAQSGYPSASRLGRRREKGRVVPLRAMPRSVAAAPVFEDRQCDCRGGGR